MVAAVCITLNPKDMYYGNLYAAEEVQVCIHNLS